MFQKIFQNGPIGVEVVPYIIIVNLNKQYVDTFDNFVLDLPSYPYAKDEYIIYNTAIGEVVDFNGNKLEEVSSAVLDDIISNIDGLINKKYDREHPFILEEYKKQAIDNVSTTRKEKETEPIVYNDIPISYDDDSRDRLRIARQGLELTGDEYVVWTSGDYGSINLTIEDINNIYVLAYKRGEILHKKYKDAEDKINLKDTDTKEKVDEIVSNAFS